MANLQEIKIRISSVQSTRQITSAMKMVSAAKLRRAQQAITQMRPYAEKLQEILQNLSSNMDAESGGAYAQQRPVKNVLLVAIASNGSLCGGFNAAVNKKIKQLIATDYKDKEVKVLTVGKKSSDFFAKTPYFYKLPDLDFSPNTLYDNLVFDNVSKVAEKVMRDFVTKKFDEIHLVYNAFKNAATQDLTVERFLPIVPEEKKKSEKTFVQDYIYEPDKNKIVSELIPKSLKTQFYKAMLDSFASEHGARMTAMHKATDNATSLLGDLNLTYNKARQAAITNEILEIVSGAEALNG